jgi:Glyoxalase-like domain
MIRLRQVALVARDLEATTTAICEVLGLTVCFRDPGVAEFGLANTLMAVGDQFIEVVSPTRDGTTAGRLLDRRDADVTGYMAIFEVDDLDEREHLLRRDGVRIVWSGDFADIRGRHLHPADVGAAIVSIDEPVPQGSWRWAGTSWEARRGNKVVTGIAGVVVGAAAPDDVARRWRSLDVAQSVMFATTTRPKDGIDAVQLVSADRSRSGEQIDIGDFSLLLV